MEKSKYLLRIGLTSACNYKCIYCNPKGNRSCKNILKDKEISEIITIANNLGINKVHLTGGEPLLRKNILSILNNVKKNKQN